MCAARTARSDLNGNCIVSVLNRIRETIRRYNGGKEHTWMLSEEPGPWTDCSKGAWISEPRTVANKSYVEKVFECQ
jgi:hypothetical protein